MIAARHSPRDIIQSMEVANYRRAYSSLLRSLPVACFWALGAYAQPVAPCIVRDELHGTATIRGTVRENKRYCAADGLCSFVVRCKGSDIEVEYGSGWGMPPHVARDVQAKANMLEPGDTVEVSGGWDGERRSKLLSLDEKYSSWVKLLRGRRVGVCRHLWLPLEALPTE